MPQVRAPQPKPPLSPKKTSVFNFLFDVGSPGESPWSRAGFPRRGMSGNLWEVLGLPGYRAFISSSGAGLRPDAACRAGSSGFISAPAVGCRHHPPHGLTLHAFPPRRRGCVILALDGQLVSYQKTRTYRPASRARYAHLFRPGRAGLYADTPERGPVPPGKGTTVSETCVGTRKWGQRC